MSEIIHPKHYNSHPSGVECIELNRYLSGNCAAAFKYVWRAGLKPGVSRRTDLAKAIFYLEDEKNRSIGTIFEVRSHHPKSSLIHEILDKTNDPLWNLAIYHIWVVGLGIIAYPICNYLLNEAIWAITQMIEQP